MKDSGCPKCKNRSLLFVKQVADRLGDGAHNRLEDGTEAGPAPGAFYPWRIARVPSGKGSFWSPHVAAAGLVSAYICKQCGYTELYSSDPGSIPVDGEYVTEIEAPGTAPYR